MGGIPTELRILINTMAAKALRDLERVERMLVRVRRAGLDRPILTTSVHQTAFTQLATLRSLIEQVRTQNTGRPPPINDAVSQKAFNEITALRAQIAAMRAESATAAATASAAASSGVREVGKAAAAGAGATAVMTSGARESGKAIKNTGDDFQKTTGLMGSFMNAQNSRLRAFGSEVQWTGRQMIHHLTMPFIMMGAYAGKTWFDQADVMTGVAKVYGDASQEVAGGAQAIANELEALESVATKLSETYGRNREEVLQVAEAWAVAGASGTALAESMNLTMQASVLGSMDAAKAAESLIAIQAQYGVSTEGLTKILAQLNYAGNKTALDIEDLAAGFQRAASVARSSGMSAAHLAGMLATIAPAAGTAEQAGNGLRMIMTRIQSQTSDTTRVIEYMNEQLGDSMISMKDFYGLPMEQKLFHLSRGYNQLGDAQRTQAAAMIAGGHQVGRMEILLRELGNETGYYNKIINELQDDSVIAKEMFQELTKNLTSDPRKIQQAWQRFRNGMAEAFVPLIPIVTHFINTIGDLVKRFAAMDPALQKLVVGIALAFAMIGPLIVVMGVFALTAAQLKPLVKAIGTLFYWLTAGPFVAFAKGLGKVHKATKATIAGILLTGDGVEKLSPKMQMLNKSIGPLARSLQKTLPSALSNLSTYVFGDFAGLSKARDTVSSNLKKMGASITDWRNRQSAENTAAQTVDTAIAAKGWAARRLIAMREWIERVFFRKQTGKEIALIEGASQAEQTAAAASGWRARVGFEKGGWLARIAETIKGSSSATAAEAKGAAARTGIVARSASNEVAVQSKALAIRNTMLERAEQIRRAKYIHSERVHAKSIGRSTALATQGAAAEVAIRNQELVASAAAEGRKFIHSERVYATGEAMKTAITSGGASSRVAITAGEQAAHTATERVGFMARLKLRLLEYAKSIGLAMAWVAKRISIFLIGETATTAIVAKFTAMRTAIVAAGGVRAAAAQAAGYALMLVTTRKGWTLILTTTLKFLGRMAAAIFAAMTGPVGLAILAGVAIFMLFGDKIRDVIQGVIDYFRNMPEGVRQGLQPIVNLWNNVVGGIQAAWNKLPGFIQAPLRAVFNMIRKAMEGIRTLLSFMNPFQRHSPSLVDNVNAGMDVIGKKFQATSNDVQSSVNAMSAAVAGLRSTFATLDAMNTAAKRAEDIEKIRAAGGPDAEAQVAAYQNVTAQVDRMKAKLGPLNRDIERQEQVVNAAAAAVERADANIDSMNKQLDAMKSHADAVSASLDAARERLDHFSSASIQGMGAVDDAMFKNTMAQKELQLQIAKLEETAGSATGGASDHFARLQGDIESLSGQRMELHFAGAGSDITDVYKGMEQQLRDEQLNIGAVGVDSGPGAEITKLQDALADLERQAEIMDLEAALKFDPLTRQIEKMTDATVELPFSTIVNGVRSSQGEISSLERTYDAATIAVQNQEAAIKQAEAARDVLSARHSEQDEALKALNDTYSAIEESIREAESALGDMTSAAEESIRRVEELARKQEEASKKAAGAAGSGAGGVGSGAGGVGSGAGGVGGAGSMSPRFSSFMEAEGAAEFGDPGEGSIIGREGFGLDQSQEMMDFNPLEGMPELDEMMGSFDMLSPIKDAWQKVVDWWNNTVFPMKNPLGDVLGGIGEAVNVNLGGENMTVLETFSGWWEKLVGIWNDWVWPAITFIGEAMRNTLTPVLENLRNVFANDLAPILKRVGERFQDMWPHIQELFKALWDIGKWILAFFIGKALLKLIIIFTAVWGVLMVGINMISHMLAPLLSWIGDMIESIILIVQGVIRVISGAINIVMGLIKTIIGAIKGMFTGDWSMALAGLDQLWQGVKDFIGGIVDIFHGLIRAIVSTIVNGARLVWGAIWGFVEGIIDFFVGLYQTIVGNSIIPDMVNAIVEWIAQLPIRVFAWVSNLVVGVVQFFINLWDKVVEIVGWLVSGVVQFFINLWNKVVEIVGWLVSGVVNYFINLWNKVVEIVTFLVDRVISFYTNLWNKVVEIVGNLVGGVVGWFQDMIGRVVGAVIDFKDRVVRGFIKIKDGIFDVFRGAKNWLVDTGKDIVRGLIDGAGKLLSRLGEFFLDKVPDFIKEPFKKALGIESPSKVFSGYGENIVEGLIVGVESKADEVQSSTQALADAAAAVEIAAPTMLAAETVDVPAMPDVPMIDAPAAITAPAMDMPDFSTPDMDALLASFNEFDAKYQLEVDGHTAGVEAEHAAMFANLDLQFQTWSVNSLLAYSNYTLAVGTILSAFALSATTLYTNLYNTLVATTTTGVNTISLVLTSATTAWLTLLTEFINALLVAWTNLINQLASLLTTGANNITSIWQSLANNFNLIFHNGIKPVFDAFLPMLQTLEGWFRSTVDNIGAIWSEVQPKTADPARFVINEVYNEGLRSAWNSFNDFLDLPELPAYTARFRDGGSVDFRNGGKAIGAGTGTSDSIQARLSNGEHVITAREVTGAGGHHAIEAQRAMWRRGRGAARSYYDGPSLHPVGNVPAFRYGGAVVGGGFTANTPTNQWLAAVVGQYFPGMTLTSGGPPGRNSADHHGGGLAIDFSNGSDTTPQMQAAARFFHQNYGRGLLELIHWPLNGWQNIKNGAPLNYGEPTNSQHRNHVHVAAPRPLGPPGSPIPPIMSGGGAAAAIDWGAYIGETFDQAFEKIKDPGFGGGVGEWVPASMKKAELAKEFITKKVEEMGAFMGTINDADGLVERWRPMVKAALIRNGFEPSLRNQNLMLAQIKSESGGIPDQLQQVIDVNSGGNEAMGLLQIIPGTFAAHRDPALPNDRTDPWANLNAALRYYKSRYGMDLGAMWGKGHGYDQGGLLPPTPGGFGTYYNHTGETEAVLTRPQWDNIYRAADAATELSYEDIVRAFKGGFASNEFESGLDKGVVQKVDPRWKELELAVFDAAELVAVASDENTETWVDEFNRIGGEVKDFFTKASEFMTSVQETAQFLASDEFWDKVKENSGESWEPAKEAFDHLSGVVQDELGSLNNITIESFGGIENAGRLLGVAGDALHQLVFDNFNVVGALNSLKAGVGGGGEVPQILRGMFEVLDTEENRAMIHQLEEHGRIVAQAIGQTLAELDFGKYYAPIIDKLADWMEKFPKYQAQYASNTTTGFANSLDSIMTRPLETMTNLLGGIYNTFLDIAPTLLRGVSGIGSSLSNFAGNNSAAMAAIVTAVVTGDPLGLIPHIPQLLALAVELIPQVIDVIINIVPTLINSLIDLFINFMPWSNQGYGTAEEALQASIDVSKRIDENNKLFFNDDRGSGSGTDPSTWRPEGASGNQNNFYGDLSFPNVTNEDDAKGFIENLSRL